MPALAAPATLIGVVLAVPALELLVLLAGSAVGRRRPLMRSMLPGAAAGLCLALALRDLAAGGHWLPLWLLGAGIAHLLDWRQRTRVAGG